MKSTLEAHTDCLLTKLEGSAGAHIRIEPTCIIITLQQIIFLIKNVEIEETAEEKLVSCNLIESRKPIMFDNEGGTSQPKFHEDSKVSFNKF